MRYLICSLNRPGFLFPAIGLALRLREKGHEVAFVAAPDTRPMLARYQLPLIPHPKDQVCFQGSSWMFVADIVWQIQHIMHAREVFKPDVVVASALAYGPMAVRLMTLTPLAILGLSFYPFPAGSKDLGHKGNGFYETNIEAIFRRLQKPLIDICQKLHIPLSSERLNSFTETPLLGDLYMIQGVPELDPDGLIPSQKACYVGSSLSDGVSPSSDQEAWLSGIDESRPLLFVQHGCGSDIEDFLPKLILGLAGECIQLVVAVSEENTPQNIPDNVVCQPIVDHRLAMSRARLVASISRSSSVVGAIRHGLPQLLFPLGLEQRVLAHLVTNRKAGIESSPRDFYKMIKMPEKLDPSRLRNLVFELMDPGGAYCKSAKNLQHSFNRFDGSNAVSLLESLT